MLGIVIMLLRFHSRIGDVRYFDVQTNFLGGLLNDVGDFQNRKSLRKLVVNAALAGRGWVQAGQFDAAHGISNIEETPLLAALAVYRQRMSNHRFHAKTV